MYKALFFNVELMKKHLTERQCKRIIRLHKRLVKKMLADGDKLETEEIDLIKDKK